MITIEKLQAFGANTEVGLSRCVNNEGLYTKLVGMILNDANFAKLDAELQAGNLEAAFEAAHALKGVTANLELTPLCEAVCEIVEPLRRREEGYPYAEQFAVIMAKLNELKAIAED